MLPLEIQAYMLAVMVVTGVALGVWYDVHRTGRRVLRWRGLVGEVADLCFWFVAALILVAGLLIGNWGSLRFYVFLGVAAGVGLYSGLAAPVLRPAWQAMWGAVARAWRGSRLPLRWLGRRCRRLGAAVLRTGRRLLSRREPPNP